jgi:hypothetical protein
MGEYYNSGGKGLEYAVKTVKRSLCAVATAILIPVLLLAQQPELQVNTAGYRSLRTAVWLLLEKTGWHISIEEPIWPSGSAGGKEIEMAEGGRAVRPPVADRLRISIPSLRGPGAQSRVVAALLGAFNSQNSAVWYKSETVGDMTVLEADTIATSAAGRRIPAPLSLSTTIQIPAARRTFTQHLVALAAAIRQQTGTPVRLDTGLGSYDVAFTGKNGPFTRAQDLLVNWGTAAQTARVALLNLLSRSKTTMLYQLNCQVGVRSAGECTLSLRPLTIEVVGRSGALKKKTVYFDRGRPDMALPPDPPDPPDLN